MKTRIISHRMFKLVVLLLVSILLFSSAGESLSIAAPVQDDPIIDAVPVDEDMMVLSEPR